MTNMVGRYGHVLLWLLWIVYFVHQTTAAKPHIIFIVADDLGWNDVGWHNEQMHTPNLDRLAINGVRFNSSYVQPVCTPSRSSFMTGYYPYHSTLQHGTLHPKNPGYLPSNFSTIADELKNLGYSTHMIGKWHLGFCNWKYTPTYRGFDSFFGFYGGAQDYYTHQRGNGYDFRWNTSVYHPPDSMYSAELYAKHAVNIINTVDPDTAPLYMYLPFQSVHSPEEKVNFQPITSTKFCYFVRYNYPANIPYWADNGPIWNVCRVPERYEQIYNHIQDKQRRTFCGMVSALDEAVGNITNALKSRGFMDNALIIFTTDNGGPTFEGSNNLPLRGGKATLWEGGTKGAAFAYSETLLRKTNYTNTEMIHAVDWFPTLLTVAGGRPGIFIDGINQWPTISQGLPSPRTEFVYNIDEMSNSSAIRVGKYKLIQGSPGKWNDWYPLPTVHMQEPVTRPNTTFPPYQLFDLEKDPTEHFDLSTKMPDVLDKMKQRLWFYMESQVPAHYPPPDPKAGPHHFGGNWSPGWC